MNKEYAQLEYEPLLNKLNDACKSEDTTKFNEIVNEINSAIVKEDNIFLQIKNLKELYKTIQDITIPSFKEQLNKVELYYRSAYDKYIPIYEDYKEQYKVKKIEKGLSFLCPDIDKLTGGIMPGTICTIAGGPGCMKTTYSMNICYHAIEAGKNVCYVSLEESTFNLYSKLLSRVSVDVGLKLPASDILQKNLEEKEEELLFDKVQPYLMNLKGKIHIIGEKELVSLQFNEFEKKLKMIDDYMIKQNEHGIDVLVIDHVQLLKYASNEKDEYRLLNEYVSFFRKQSLSFLNTGREISVLLLSQVNREGIEYAQKHQGTYKLQHIAEGSEIERASSYIISLYTDGTVQISKMLRIGAIKLRGAALPLNPFNVFADGECYNAGTIVPELDDYSPEDLFDSPSDTSQQMKSNIFPKSDGAKKLDDLLSMDFGGGV